MASKSVPVGSKSDRIRAAVAREIAVGNPHAIAAARREVGVDYGFAYGVASRAGLTRTGATRRAEPNAKVRATIAAVHPEWSADRIARTAAALVAGEPAPKK